MAKVLYITAHPHDESQSFSMATGKAFIDAYKEHNSSDEVYILTFIKKISLILMQMYLAAGANFSLALNFLLMNRRRSIALQN